MLPKYDLPLYQHELFGLKKKIQFRPFTTKEQKILLLAKEEGESAAQAVKEISEQAAEYSDSVGVKAKQKEIVTKALEQKILAIKQIVSNCTMGKVDVDRLPFFDIEDLFLQMRIRSVSDTAEITFRERKKASDSTLDEPKKHKVEIDLKQVKVKAGEGHDKKIMLTDTLGIMMKYPTIDDIYLAGDKGDSEMLPLCIDYIFDGTNIYKPEETSKEELDNWIDGLDTGPLVKLQTFFKTMPRLRHEEKVTLSDGKIETVKFEGLESFFL